uniref:Uncharacterized protein MANES_02G056100 n=2 Tax=Rhizophora mucronata TaxID=61149 RepID=A0A2P2M8E5_RHIMU
MSAKFIYNLSDETPDLQKQIGCMNGIFQLFDRPHFLGGGRRIIGQNHKRLPPGQRGRLEVEPKREPENKERYQKAMKEKHRISTESSRTSFSSSTYSSSLSSLECNKQSQVEPPVLGRTIIPETHAWDSAICQPSTSLQASQLSVNLSDVVKDSIYREARGLSVKTSKAKSGGQTLKYIDSPRPLQHSQYVNPRVSCGKESPQLHKFQEASCKPSEVKRDSLTSALRDTRRFSCDGRESRDSFKSTIKLQDLPRLSLDSREGSMRYSTAEVRPNNVLGRLAKGNENSNNVLNRQEEAGCQRGPSSVVAKLMGLETLPEPISTNRNHTRQIHTISDVQNDPFSVPSRTTYENKKDLSSGSPRNSRKESISPRLRNAEADKKPMESSKFPIEPAPWKQADGGKGCQTTALKSQVNLMRSSNSSLSVYGEIEKRLAQLEFQKSGKDLRALKQILETMQKTKEVLKARDNASNLSSQTSSNGIPDQGSNLRIEQNLQERCPSSTLTKTNSPKTSKSPIVIMKPAKFIEKHSHVTSSMNPGTKCSGLSKHTAKDLSPRRSYPMGRSSQLLEPIDKNTGSRLIRLAQTTNNMRTPTKESTSMSKGSSSMNLLQQHKKLGLEKQSRPVTPSPDSSRTRRQPTRQQTESSSPRRKPRPKPSVDEYGDISSYARDFSYQGESISLQSESNISFASQNDEEVLSIDRSNKTSGTSTPQSHRTQKNPAIWSTKGRSIAKPAILSSEQPSPISVLDAAFCSDELPSPIKKKSIFFNDDEAVNSGEMQWDPAEVNPSFSSSNSTLNSLHDHNRMENMKTLIQNLKKQILSGHEEPISDEITSSYNSSNPNHRYVSEIFLASGLLQDFESINLHPTSHPINPNLFVALEKAKASTRHINEALTEKKMSEAQGKIQRKLLFDVMNEILDHKLQLESSCKQWPSRHIMAKQGPKGHQLLKELCSEIDRLQSSNTSRDLDEEDDNLRSILWADMMHQSMHWTACHSEVPGLVLDIERLIFKELINEVVIAETIALQRQPARHCRRLFSQ